MPTELQQRLACLLGELDISAGKLSRDMNHSPSYVASILNGHNKTPGQDFFDYMEVCFNVNPQWLKNGSGEMFREGGKQNNFSTASLFKFLTSLPTEEQEAIKVIIRALYFKQHRADRCQEEMASPPQK